MLPMILVFREGTSHLYRRIIRSSAFVYFLCIGMEAIIFVGGVSLGQPATSIPLATIVGVLCAIICGALIYVFAIRTSWPCFPHLPHDAVVHKHFCSADSVLGDDDELHPANRCRAVYQSSVRTPKPCVRISVSRLPLSDSHPSLLHCGSALTNSLAPGPTRRTESAQAHTTSGAMFGILIAVAPITNYPNKDGQYSMLSSDGRTMHQVCTNFSFRLFVTLSTNWHFDS
jgi:hypothetical protein